jgi:hypothetical protein
MCRYNRVPATLSSLVGAIAKIGFASAIDNPAKGSRSCLGNLKYLPTQRRIQGNFPDNERGRKAALRAGYEQWVSKANAASKVPQGLATVQQFYETRFQVDHVDRLKKSGRLHDATMWRTTLRRH